MEDHTLYNRVRSKFNGTLSRQSIQKVIITNLIYSPIFFPSYFLNQANKQLHPIIFTSMNNNFINIILHIFTLIISNQQSHQKSLPKFF